jgi:hypothetical protein
MLPVACLIATPILGLVDDPEVFASLIHVEGVLGLTTRKRH